MIYAMKYRSQFVTCLVYSLVTLILHCNLNVSFKEGRVLQLLRSKGHFGLGTDDDDNYYYIYFVYYAVTIR